MAAISDAITLRSGARRPRPVRTPLSFARRKPLSAAAAVVLAATVALAVAAPWVAPFGPDDVDLAARLAGPGGEHWLGADHLGRDVWTRLLYGGRVSITVGIGATLIGTTAGVVVGLVSGYAGGYVDLALQRVMDAMMSLPPIITLMVLATMLSPSMRNVVIAIGIFVMPGASRVVRGAVLGVKEMTYIESARSVGASPLRIVARHIFPNIFAPVIILVSIGVGSAIIIEAALGFLGLSVRPPAATWGNMLNTGAQSYMEDAPWMALAPGGAIAVTVFSINLLGDGLRDVLDPRLRGKGR